VETPCHANLKIIHRNNTFREKWIVSENLFKEIKICHITSTIDYHVFSSITNIQLELKIITIPKAFEGSKPSLKVEITLKISLKDGINVAGSLHQI